MLILLGTAACGGGGSDSNSSGNNPPIDPPEQLDDELTALAKTRLGLTGDPATPRGMSQVVPNDNPLVKLGQLLFFSQTLAAGYDVSCGTCHHPDFALGDGLSISVGVIPQRASVVGPGRVIDAARDLDSNADGGPNMHRNSITTINSGLMDRGLMFDGRVHVLEDGVVPGGHGQLIQTPESGQGADLSELSGLMEFTMKSPIVNDNEMRGFLYTQYATATDYREHLIRRLRGEEDVFNNPNPLAAENWLARFRAAFAEPGGDAATLITIDNAQRALAAYVNSQIFVDTPWRRYLEGDLDAISSAAKRGALLFLGTLSEGGLGCVSCHAGDRFTDEEFHNVAFPQIGRGFQRADDNDLGRWTVTRVDENMHAFRTLSLLNVAQTGPYGHAGSFQTLRQTIRYHANPRNEVNLYNFSLVQLEQFATAGITYPRAEEHTRSAIAEASFATAEALLPRRSLSLGEETDLVQFLATLTDDCVASIPCISRWTPDPSEDPDGNMLIRDTSIDNPNAPDTPTPSSYPNQISMNFPPTGALTTFTDVESCVDGLNSANNTGELRFAMRSDPSFGLDDPHGYGRETWFQHSTSLEITMIGGGVSAGYLVDDDCWPDLIYTSGDVAGMIVYRNLAGSGYEPVDILEGLTELEYTGAGIADLNGDYRREIVLGNVKSGDVPILAQDGTGRYTPIAALPMTRPTYGISFMPLDSNAMPFFFLAHWAGGSGTDGTSPALWKNDGTSVFRWDASANTLPNNIDQRFNFTPKFNDFTGDGLMDLVIASDFMTSVTMRNVAADPDHPEYVNDTERAVITDENGMGSALLDIDNDGNLEWFVTSVFEENESGPAGNWGQTGNRLYRSISTADEVQFEDITTAAGVRDGYWGWGACAADVNNDGFIDLFHVNGFGWIPEDVAVTDEEIADREYNLSITGAFRDRPGRLFINDGDGSFTESAGSWQIDVPSEGRGLACFDYDRDGDIDITVFDHSTGLQFFENQSGTTDRHFLNIRLVGQAPNTDALGARVYLTANVGNGHGTQTQLRLSEANSNFNSQNLPDLHFGLGQANVANELRVVWPDASETVCQNVPADRFIVLDQRDGAAACPAP